MMQSNIILERIRDGRVISRHEARNTLTSVFIGYAAGRIGGGMGVALAGDLTFRLLNSGGSLIKTLTGADALGSAINFTNSTVTEIAQDEEHTDTYTVASIQVWRDTVHISTVDAADWTPAVVESPSGETLRITYVLSLQYSGRVFATTNTRLQGGGQLTVDTVAVRRHMFGVLMGAPLFTPAASLLRTTPMCTRASRRRRVRTTSTRSSTPSLPTQAQSSVPTTSPTPSVSRRRPNQATVSANASSSGDSLRTRRFPVPGQCSRPTIGASDRKGARERPRR